MKFAPQPLLLSSATVFTQNSFMNHMMYIDVINFERVLMVWKKNQEKSKSGEESTRRYCLLRYKIK
jgi:hypothetical protein